MTTLVEEEPYAAVVLDRYVPLTCSKCFASNLIGSPERVHLRRCTGCYFLYYCSKECQKSDWVDHKTECKFLRSFPVDLIPGFNTRLVFRMLMKAKSQPNFKAFNGRTYDSLMEHCVFFRAIDGMMITPKKLYAEIEGFLGPKTPSFETVLLAFSKKEVNSFTIFDGTEGCEPRGSGIYIGLSVHDHSCRPDAFVMIVGSKLQLRSTKKNCVYSEKLTISYQSGHFFHNTYMRRTTLISLYFFNCKCEECEDEEADKPRTSGRPTCCDKGWFSISDLRCSICNKEVPIERGAMAQASNKNLQEVMVLTYAGAEGTRSPGYIDKWISLFEEHKEILSDENTNLIGMADMIYNTTLLQSNFEISIKYADICLSQIRQRPYELSRATFLCKRFMLYVITGKPLTQTKQVLEEAIEAVEVVYGKKHEVTRSLLAKKLVFDKAVRVGMR